MPTRRAFVPLVGKLRAAARGGIGARLIGAGGVPAVKTSPPGIKSYLVSGVTVDLTGTPIAGMTVYLFRAVSMELIAQGISDGSGNYALVSSTNAGNFVVVSFHPDGSLAGVTRPVLEAL